MNLPNLPMSRWQRWCLVLLRKPVLWAFMVCTSGATLMMVQSMAQTQMPGWPKPSAKQTAAGSMASSNSSVAGGELRRKADREARPDETDR